MVKRLDTYLENIKTYPISLKSAVVVSGMPEYLVRYFLIYSDYFIEGDKIYKHKVGYRDSNILIIERIAGNANNVLIEHKGEIKLKKVV